MAREHPSPNFAMANPAEASKGSESVSPAPKPRTPLRKLARWAYRVTGTERRVDAGLLVLDLSVVLPNFLFQRILGVNRRCPWPVHYTSRVMCPERITVGRKSAVSFAVSGGCYIQAFNGIEIGDNVMFAAGVKIVSANHDMADRARHVPCDPVRIGDGCWIGANAVILPGVSLGANVVVGAGAIMTRSFPDNVVIAGNPARIIKQLA